MIPPRKPFPDYKWRWATLTPTEGLNEPPIYLGVLRVLLENEGDVPNSAGVAAGLARVQREVVGRVTTHVHLDRGGDRNLLRNSSQYWKALGLLAETRGIELTGFGREVAEGRITRDEFAATVVAALELPNRAIQSPADCAEWDEVGLRIRPLQLLLSILRGINDRFGAAEAFLTLAELIRIVIPLAGNDSPLDEHVESIVAYRHGRLNAEHWPDCAPDANDKRMAREFLLFLSYYGFCYQIPAAEGDTDRYVLQIQALPDIETLIEIPVLAEPNPLNIVGQVREGHATALVERVRVLRPVLERPQQARFRQDVLLAYAYSCAITGERIPETLEAAHIIPVEYHGTDTVGNGICLRRDMHSLFDSGHIRIDGGGHLEFSEPVEASPNYRALPRQLALPRFVSRECLEWRWNYQ